MSPIIWPKHWNSNQKMMWPLAVFWSRPHYNSATWLFNTTIMPAGHRLPFLTTMSCPRFTFAGLSRSLDAE
jgi:hypothetical protein